MAHCGAKSIHLINKATTVLVIYFLFFYFFNKEIENSESFVKNIINIENVFNFLQ